MKTSRHLAILSVGLLFLLGAAAKPSRPMVIAVSTEPSTLDGQAVIDRNSRVASGNIFESLLDRGANGQVITWLAESYKPVNDTTWRFRLRKNVKFHNGEPFNAEAAAFSVNRIVDKEYKTQRASYIENIKGAKAVDEYTIEVTTDGARADDPTGHGPAEGGTRKKLRRDSYRHRALQIRQVGPRPGDYVGCKRNVLARETCCQRVRRAHHSRSANPDCSVAGGGDRSRARFIA